MDANRFDALTRLLAERRLSRRAAISGAAGLLAALGLRQAAGAQMTQAQCGNVRCARDPGVCNDGCVCCVYSNGNSRCRPPGTCAPGQAVCPEGEVVDPVRGCVATTTTTTTTTAAPTTTTTTAMPTTTTTTTTLAPGACSPVGPACGTVGPPTFGCNGNSTCFCVATLQGPSVCISGRPGLGQACPTGLCPAGEACVRDTCAGPYCSVLCPEAGPV